MLLALLFAGNLAVADSIRVPFAYLAEELALPVEGGKCRHSRRELVELQDGGVDDPGDWSCYFFKRDLKRDVSDKCRPFMKDVFSPWPSDRVEVKGNLAYIGLMPLQYHYDVVTEGDGTTTVEVRVRVYGEAATDAELARLDKRLKMAALIWQEASPIPGLRFRFVRAQDNWHFSVKLVDRWTRGPYLAKWSTYYSASTLAHEIGHMLGLDDEYDNVGMTIFHGGSKCDSRSIMCSQYGAPRPYHYYLMLRRAAPECG